MSVKILYKVDHVKNVVKGNSAMHACKEFDFLLHSLFVPNDLTLLFLVLFNFCPLCQTRSIQI